MTIHEKKILETIKGKLKKGDVAKIAEGLLFSRGHVSRCLSTEQDAYNQDVVNAATLLIANRKSKRKYQLKQIKKILE